MLLADVTKSKVGGQSAQLQLILQEHDWGGRGRRVAPSKLHCRYHEPLLMLPFERRTMGQSRLSVQTPQSTISRMRRDSLRTGKYREASPPLVSAFARRVVWESQPMRRLPDTCTMQLRLRCYTKPSMPKTTDAYGAKRAILLLLVENPYQMQRAQSIKGWAGQVVSAKAVLFCDQVWSVNQIPGTVQRRNSQD